MYHQEQGLNMRSSMATQRLARCLTLVSVLFAFLAPPVNVTGSNERSLSFYHTHARKELTVV